MFKSNQISLSNRFPPVLLKEAPGKRLAYFEHFTVAHPLLRDAYEQAIKFIGKEGAKAAMLSIYGPTGVGKTTLANKLVKTLMEWSLPVVEVDRGHVPVVMVEAVAPESGSFRFDDYFIRCLIALEEPLIDYKVDYGTPKIHRVDGRFAMKGQPRTPELQRALENALKYRRPHAVLIDEAQHLQIMKSGRRAQDNMDCLKSIVNLTGITHVFIGTYEVLRYLNLSGQLSRRNPSVHFRRYQVELAEDMEAFRSILVTLQMQMPLEKEPDLYALWEYLYARSLGCIGILKEWLTRAFADALAEGALTLTETHLQRRALSVAQCKRILQEINEGEKALQETPEDCDDLYRAVFGSNTAVSSPSKVVAKPNRRSGKVGKRRPQRDPVEAQQNVG